MILSPTLSNTTNSAANRLLDIYSSVEKNHQPISNKPTTLAESLHADKATLSGVGQLQNRLANFQGMVQSLAGQGMSLFATTSNSKVLEPTTSGASMAGRYEIQVSQLAQSQVLQSQALASADVAIGNFGASKLSIEFGTLSPTGFSSIAAKTLVIAAGENTLQGVSDAINNANTGVAARLVTKPEGVALEMISPGGASNSMRIGVSGDAAMQALLSFNPFEAKGMAQTVAAQDAVLSINGETVSSFSNTVKFGVPGTMLALKSTGATTLTIEQGTAQIEQNVSKFVEAYNTLNAQLDGLNQGDLKADGSALQIRSQLSQALAATERFSAIGITMQSNGNLRLDQAQLRDAVSKDATAVSQLFGEGGEGLADHLNGLIQGFIGPIGSLPKKAATITQAIAALNATKNRVEQASPYRGNSAAEKYAQQQNISSNWASTNSPLGQLKGSSLRFDFPA